MTWSLDPEETERHVLHRLASFDGRDVLEIGCGDGRLTWRYADHAASVLALDPDRSQLATAEAQLPATLRQKVRFSSANIVVDPIPVAAFDIAILAWSI